MCVTSSNVVTSEGVVEMRFDRAAVTYKSDTFSYVDDPLVFTLDPDKSILRCACADNVLV